MNSSIYILRSYHLINIMVNFFNFFLLTRIHICYLILKMEATQRQDIHDRNCEFWTFMLNFEY